MATTESTIRVTESDNSLNMEDTKVHHGASCFQYGGFLNGGTLKSSSVPVIYGIYGTYFYEKKYGKILR